MLASLRLFETDTCYRRHQGLLSFFLRIPSSRLTLDPQALGIQRVTSHGISWLEFEKANKRYLLETSIDGTCAVYDTAKLDRWNRESPKHTHPVLQFKAHLRGAAIMGRWLPTDPGLLVTCSANRDVIAWDTTHQESVVTFKVHESPTGFSISSFSPSNFIVAVGCRDGSMSFCNLLTGRVERTYEGIHDGRTTVVEWRDNNQSLITCGEDGMVKYWDIRRMDECIFLSDTVFAASTGVASMPAVHGGCGHHGHVTGCVFSPQGDILMTSGWDQTIHVWSMTDMKLIHVINGVKNRRILARIQMDTNHDGSVLFHPNAFPGQDGVSLFDVEQGDLITTLDGHPGIVSCCAYQTDKNELYTGGKNGFLCVWKCRDTFLYAKPDASAGEEEEEVDEWSDND